MPIHARAIIRSSSAARRLKSKSTLCCLFSGLPCDFLIIARFHFHFFLPAPDYGEISDSFNSTYFFRPAHNSFVFAGLLDSMQVSRSRPKREEEEEKSMSYFCVQQTRPRKKAYDKVPTTTEQPIRRIFRFGNSGDNSGGKTTESRNNSSQQDINPPGREGDNSGKRELSRLNSSVQQKPASAACCCCQHKTLSSDQKAVPKEEDKFKKFDPQLPRFGPSYGKEPYGEEPEQIRKAKEQAWEQVLNKTGDKESSIFAAYESAIRTVEKEARDTYDPTIVNRLKPPEFRRMMRIDGCFFLQLALHFLGGFEQLGYPENHLFFGRYNDNSKWIKAMFFVGNQIPCVVIHELMKQSFFQNVIAKGTWNLPPDLPKKVLYLMVVLPELKRTGRSSTGIFSSPIGQKAPFFPEDPCDLLHGLHCLVLGPGADPLDLETDEDAIDLEAGTEDTDKKSKFPSATELQQLGISFRKAKQGIRDIHFEKRFLFFGCLCVPPFTFDGDTKLILEHLKNYEIGQQLGKRPREVAAYLRFMKDLIQTQKDVKILVSNGIIEVVKKNHEDKLPGILNKLGSSEDISFTENLRLAKLKVTTYSSPHWRLVSVAFIFALVQTLFTVLAYFRPPK